MHNGKLRLYIKPDIFDIIANCDSLEYQGLYWKPDYKKHYTFSMKNDEFLVWIPHEEDEEFRRYKITMPNLSTVPNYRWTAEKIAQGSHKEINDSIERGIADGSLLTLLNVHTLL